MTTQDVASTIYIYIYIYTHIYVYTYIYIYVHTQALSKGPERWAAMVLANCSRTLDFATLAETKPFVAFVLLVLALVVVVVVVVRMISGINNIANSITIVSSNSQGVVSGSRDKFQGVSSFKGVYTIIS